MTSDCIIYYSPFSVYDQVMINPSEVEKYQMLKNAFKYT